MRDDANVSDPEAIPETVNPGVQLELPTPETVEVEGVALSSGSSASALKMARASLGIGRTGSRTVLWKRLVRHMQRRQKEDNLTLQEAACPQEQPARPESARSRRDKHQQGAGAHRSDGGWPAISLDLFYYDVDGDDFEFRRAVKVQKGGAETKRPVVICVDRDSGVLRAIPLPTKDSQSCFVVHDLKWRFVRTTSRP